MVKSVINGITTYYASSSYVVEVDGSDTTVRKTYSAGSTSLAVRTIVNGTTETLNWLLSDHLGSSSITTMADGTWNSEIRYSAFGETRYSSGITPTDYRYTGQLEQKDVNLYYYNARYYDAALGRFVQADTIIPGAGNSKSYDRYAYVGNNPLIYIDPSGHCYADSGAWIPDGLGGACMFKTSNQVKDTKQQLDSFGITIDNGNGNQNQVVLDAVKYVARKLASTKGNYASPQDTFSSTHGSIHIILGATTDIDGKTFDGNCITNSGTISCKNDLTIPNTVHEFGHAFESQIKSHTGIEASGFYPLGLNVDGVLTYIDYNEDTGIWDRSYKGYLSGKTSCEHVTKDTDIYYVKATEQFADLFMNWILT